MALTDVEKVDARRFAGYGLDDPAIDPQLLGLSAAAETVVRAQIILLRTLEQAIWDAGGGRLSTNQAAVWHRNTNEIAERQALYYSARLLLCNLLAVPPGAFIGSVGVSASSGDGIVPAVFVV